MLGLTARIILDRGLYHLTKDSPKLDNKQFNPSINLFQLGGYEKLAR
jgi:hypothetical protein